jgi:hypothetical protein
MKHVEVHLINVGFCIVHVLRKWTQLQYEGKRYSNLRTFHVNQLGRTLGDMSLEGANYVQDFPKLFYKIEQYHAREMCLKQYFIHRLNNGIYIC